MKTLILAAGYGIRLYPLTKNMPKPLLPVSGRPIIDHILEKLEPIQDSKDIFVVSNNKFFRKFKIWSKRCENKFKKFNVRIFNDGSNTNEDRIGAIGDILFALTKGKIKEDVLLIGGDNIFSFGLKDFIAFAQAKSPSVSIGLYDIKNIKKATRFGVAAIDGSKKVVSFEEKPQYPKSSLIGTCIYYFPKESLKYIFSYIKKKLNKDAPGQYIKWLHKIKPVYGFVFKGKWHDIGHLDYYNRIKDSF